MDTPTPSLRDQGIQALQEGNLDKAVDFLARAVMADDNDAEAKALLGVAYSQKGLHVQAKRALQTATELQPQNPNFRFNLGVVLERAGDAQGAAVAYRDTLGVNPQHAQARARLQALGPQAQALLNSAPRPAAPGVPGYGAPPAPGAPPPSPGMPPAGPSSPPGPMAPPMGAPGGGPPPGAPPLGMPPMGAPPAPGAGPASSPFSSPPPPPPGQPGMGGGLNAPQGPPGTVQCPRCHQFTRPGMSCELCSAPLAPPPRPSPPPPGPGAYPAMGVGGYPGGPGMGYAGKPHRGGLIVTLGILGLVVCGLCGIAAVIMGNQDIAEMDMGTMDPSGRSATQTGRVLGIISCCFMVLGCGLGILNGIISAGLHGHR